MGSCSLVFFFSFLNVFGGATRIPGGAIQPTHTLCIFYLVYWWNEVSLFDCITCQYYPRYHIFGMSVKNLRISFLLIYSL